MTEKFSWEYYKYKRYCARIKQRITGTYFTHYAGKKLMSLSEGNKRIIDLLSSRKPCAVARFGSVEVSVLAEREAQKLGKREKCNDHILCTSAGFFPEDKKMIDLFADTIIRNVHEIDLLGIWYNPAEEFIADRYMKNTAFTGISAIEPYVFTEPWSACLENKKVLVVHPFAESIKKQYAIHHKLFDNKKVLPDFELKVIKAVQTIAGTVDDRFSNWFEALQYMKERMENTDFDVAIIGCGAYGMPLAIYAKQMGKQAVHMGGATQILFGIKGHRWDENRTISNLYNEYWIRPNQSETVEHQEKVEGGCYW